MRSAWRPALLCFLAAGTPALFSQVPLAPGPNGVTPRIFGTDMAILEAEIRARICRVPLSRLSRRWVSIFASTPATTSRCRSRIWPVRKTR